MMKKLALSLAFISLFSFGCQQKLEEYSYEFYALDTVILITLYAPDQRTAIDAFVAAENEVMRIYNLTDRFALLNSPDPNQSDIYRINQHPGESVEVSLDTLIMLKTALDISDQSQGAFDVTVAPLMDLWDFMGKKYVPTNIELEELLHFVDYRQIQIDEEAKTVTINPGFGLDFGAIAKGYATDCAVKALRQKGIKHALINAGGNVYAIGEKPDGKPWRIGIRHPREDGELLGVVEVVDQAVVTSGDYERYFEENGLRYHHIVDPKTGFPANTAYSVTIVSDTSMIADCLSTAVFVMGRDSIQMIPMFPKTEALIMDDKGIATTIGFNSIFSFIE